jgi:hypothetical protein
MQAWGWVRRSGSALAAVVIATAALVGTAAEAGAIELPACPGGGIAAFPDSYETTFSPVTKSFVVESPGLLANDCGGRNVSVDVEDSGDIFSDMASNQVFINANGKMTYWQDESNPFTGIDTFDYTIKKNDDWDFNSVEILIKPVVKGESYATKSNTPLTVAAAAGITANDLGIDPMIWDAPSTTTAGGTLEVNIDDGSFTYTPPPDFSGNDSFTYEVSDINFDNTYFATATIAVGLPPLSAMSAPLTRVTLSTSLAVQWAPTGPSATSGGNFTYTVQRRQGPWNDVMSTWSTWKSGVSSTTGTFTGQRGWKYCFRSAASEDGGPLGPWSAEKCTAVPLKVTSLTYSGGWKQVSASDAYGGVYRTTKTKNAWAKRTNIRAERIYVVVTKCPTCGTLQVRWNNNVKATIKLTSATKVRKQVVHAFALSKAATGTLSLHVTSSNKIVTLEGVAAYIG